jgi:hypothetical protein
MKTRFLLSTVAMLALAGTAPAATVSITVSSAGNVPKYVDSLGNLLGTGDAIRVGFFNTSGGNLSTLQNSNVYADINALFTPLAEGITNAGTVNEVGAGGTNLVINDLFATGNVFGQITNIDSTYCTTGSELAVWVFNNADPTLATQWGIFTTTSGWEFPAALGSSTLATNEIDTIIRGSSAGGNFLLSNISVVPEPGSWMLLAAGAVVLNGRRRRRTSAGF